MSNIQQYFPNVYDNVTEIQVLSETENTLLTAVESHISESKDNQFIMTSDLTGVEYFERLFAITPDPSVESLDFRRQRVLSRFTNLPPYTMKWLHAKFDTLIGPGKWATILDTNTYTLYVESSATDQQWYQEIQIIIAGVKPANIVFVNKPYVSNEIDASEEIRLEKKVNNYTLGVNWFLGVEPFATMRDRGVIKMSAINSIEAAMLGSVATFVASDIAKVKLNDSIVITSFNIKSAAQNVVTVEYEVPLGLDISSITSVKLLDSDNTVLTDVQVFVPYEDNIVMKHTLIVKEG